MWRAYHRDSFLCNETSFVQRLQLSYCVDTIVVGTNAQHLFNEPSRVGDRVGIKNVDELLLEQRESQVHCRSVKNVLLEKEHVDAVTIFLQCRDQKLRGI